MIHLVNRTTPNIVLKSIANGNGLASCKGIVQINEIVENWKNNGQ
jgi:Fe-S cluster assembly scaffold protein SufB